MEKTDKLEQLSHTRKWAHGRLLKLESPVYKAFLELERTTFADGVLERRQKELIALGISVVLNCESCMQWHIEQAARAGATTAMVLEALEVGIEMGGGPATVAVRFALQAMDRVFGPPQPAEPNPAPEA